MVAFNMVDHLWHGVFGEPEKGLGYPRMLTPWRRPYATADGYICLLATTDRQWRNLFAAIDCAAMIEDPRFCSIPTRTANIDALYTILGERMRRRSTAEWRERLDAADVPNGVVNDMMAVAFAVKAASANGTEVILDADQSAGPVAHAAVPPAASALDTAVTSTRRLTRNC